MRNIILSFALAALALAAPAAAQTKAESDALAGELLSRNNRTVDLLRAQKSAGELTSQSALSIIQQEMSPALDFDRLTRRAMGKHWKSVDDASRRQITEAFQKLLENTYAKVLAKYNDQQVKLAGAEPTPAGDGLSVRMQVTGDGKDAVIDYILSPNDKGDWLVIDIKVENVSLVGNYRRQFNRILSAGGAPELAKKLAQLAQKASR